MKNFPIYLCFGLIYCFGFRVSFHSMTFDTLSPRTSFAIIIINSYWSTLSCPWPRSPLLLYKTVFFCNFSPQTILIHYRLRELNCQKFYFPLRRILCVHELSWLMSLEGLPNYRNIQWVTLRQFSEILWPLNPTILTIVHERTFWTAIDLPCVYYTKKVPVTLHFFPDFPLLSQTHISLYYFRTVFYSSKRCFIFLPHPPWLQRTTFTLFLSLSPPNCRIDSEAGDVDGGSIIYPFVFNAMNLFVLPRRLLLLLLHGDGHKWGGESFSFEGAYSRPLVN